MSTFHNLSILKLTSVLKTAHIEADQAHQKTEKNKKYNEEQKNAADQMLKCESEKYYQILNVKNSSLKEKIKTVYKKLTLLLHPDKNKYKYARETFESKQNSVTLFRII